MTRHLRALSALLVALLPLCGAEAQSLATFTLSTNAALWNDVVVARIEADACGLDASSPVVGFTPGVGWTVDIHVDITYCNITPPRLTTLVEIGPLYPQDYLVRVFDQSFEVGTAPLSIYRTASVSVELPAVATDAAPFPLVLRGPAPGPCFVLDPPQVQGKVITATFDANCPIIPIPGPFLFEEEATLGPLPAGEYEVRFFEWPLDLLPQQPRPLLHRQTLTVYDTDKCVPSDTALCLQDERFRIEVDWKDFEGHAGKGHPIPLPGREDSGLFWFFRNENVELTAKVLNGCNLGGSWWVFLSSGSTVEYTVKVTDTQTGSTKTYTNDRGESAPLVADTAAFPCFAP